MSTKKAMVTGLHRQRRIYLDGFRGKRALVPFTFEALEKAAGKKISKEAFNYIAAGAGNRSAVKHNEDAFQRIRTVPRVLREVDSASMETKFCGVPLDHPVLLSPVGVLSLAHPTADLGVARGARESSTPFIFSNQASVPMESTAQVMGPVPYWFQLYWSRSEALVRSFAERAEQCGCKGIVVTLDTTMLGWRPMDLEHGFLPFLHGEGLGQYISDPQFNRMIDEAESEESTAGRITFTALRRLLRLMRRYPGGTFSNFRTGRPLKAVRLFTRIYTNPQLQWADLEKLREYTRLPILLKGILHPEDARIARESGVDGIILSNHGGRQVESAVPPIVQLPAVREVVGKSYPLAIDSGIRTGADIFKCIRLGADAVCIGRPYVYALALGGARGVNEYLANLLADLDLTMKLSGCRNIGEIRETDINFI